MFCDPEEKVSERKIGNLSKRFKQGLVLILIVVKPRLVILDEPTIGWIATICDH